MMIGDVVGEEVVVVGGGGVGGVGGGGDAPGSYSYLGRHVEHTEPHHPEQPSWFHVDRTHKLLQPCDHLVTHLHEKSHFQKERLSLVGHIWEAFQLHEYNSVIEFRVRTDLDVQLKWALLALRQFFWQLIMAMF